MAKKKTKSQNKQSSNADVENIVSKKKWYETGLIQSITAIATILGFAIAYYEYYRIPTLSSKIESLEKEKINIGKELEKWKSSSELAKLQKDFKNQQELLKAKDEKIASQKDYIQEISNSRIRLSKQLDETRLNDQKWNNLRIEQGKRLEVCEKNLNIKGEINKLRKIIAYNNERINQNDIFKPSDVQIQTWQIDNQNLNEMIFKYQNSLQCQN